MGTPMKTRKGSLNADHVTELKLLIKNTKAEIINVLGEQNEELRSVKHRIESLFSCFYALEKTVASIQNKQTELESEITAVKSNLEGLAEKSRKTTFSEMEGRISKMSEYTMGEVQQQIDRSCNLIVSGLQEKTVGSVEDRTRHDLAEFQRLCETIEVHDVKVEKCFRIGARRQDGCLLYTSPSPRDLSTSRMPSSA